MRLRRRASVHHDRQPDGWTLELEATADQLDAAWKGIDFGPLATIRDRDQQRALTEVISAAMRAVADLRAEASHRRKRLAS